MSNEYVLNAIPIYLCKGSSSWWYMQLSSLQQTRWLNDRNIKFYTNLNRWNLSTEAEKKIYDSMESDSIGKWAYLNVIPSLFDDFVR
jgi:hypothetical protein